MSAWTTRTTSWQLRRRPRQLVDFTIFNPATNPQVRRSDALVSRNREAARGSASASGVVLLLVHMTRYQIALTTYCLQAWCWSLLMEHVLFIDEFEGTGVDDDFACIAWVKHLTDTPELLRAALEDNANQRFKSSDLSLEAIETITYTLDEERTRERAQDADDNANFAPDPVRLSVTRVQRALGTMQLRISDRSVTPVHVPS